MSETKTEVWSCGGGTQSGAIATLIRQGRLPRPDFAFMTDTGREGSATWPFVDGYIRPQLAEAGVELTVVPAADFTDHLDVVYVCETGALTTIIPAYSTQTYSKQSGLVGKLSPFCSGKWKRDVGERWMRSVGVKTARNWIGISRDEPRRVRAQHRSWLEPWYPLITKVPMTRARCVELIRNQGWTGQIPHSACWMCPNHSDSEWLEMKLHWPADFAAACEVEREMQEQDPDAWLHPSCVPLGEVDFHQQQTMFPERGCYGGCFT